MSCPEFLRTQAWLDGELEGRAASEAERHAETCAECQRLRADFTELSNAIRAHATRYRAPQALREQINASLARRPPALRVSSNSFWYGTASGVGISALAAGLAFFLLVSAPSLVESVTDAHTRALMSGQTIAVVSSNHHTVKPWFAGRVAVSPPVADFAGAGFALAGGRVDEIAGEPSAVEVYRHGKHEIDLFVWADRGWSLPGEGIRHGYHTIFWKSGDLDFAAVSDMEEGELKRFVGLVKSERE